MLCDEIEGLSAPPDGLNACQEVCGDGKHLGYNECDDGNTLDNDGCNGFCQLEPGYLCEGGSPTTPSVCKDTLPPSILTARMDNLFQVTV